MCSSVFFVVFFVVVVVVLSSKYVISLNMSNPLNPLSYRGSGDF